MYKASSAPGDLLYIWDGSTVQIKISHNDNGSLNIVRDGVVLGTTLKTNLIKQNLSGHIQLKIVFSNTVGSAELKFNNETVLLLQNIDTCSTANEYCNGAGPALTPGWQAQGNFDNFWIDDTDFNGDLAIETLYPNGAGSNTSWIPSAGLGHECVDEALFNEDTDYISSVTVDAVETYAYADPSLIGAIKAIQQTIIARRDEDGTNKIAPVVKVGETIQVGSTVPLVLPYTFNSVIYNTNPADSQAWEIVDLNGAEFGVKIIE